MTFRDYMHTPNPALDQLVAQAEVARETAEDIAIDTAFEPNETKCAVTIAPEHAKSYAVIMSRYAGVPFLPESIGFVTHETKLSEDLTVCFVDWLPLGMYPNNPATAINKKYLQELN